MKDREFLNHLHQVLEHDFNFSPLCELMLKLRAIELTTDKFKDSALNRVKGQNHVNDSKRGKWRTTETPYQREMMDAFTNKDLSISVIVLSGSAIGKTKSVCISEEGVVDA